MEELNRIDRARALDHSFRNFDTNRMEIDKPIDERSLIAAASDPKTVPIQQLRNLHTENEHNDQQRVLQTWKSLANQLPKVSQHAPTPQPTQPTQAIQPPKKFNNRIMQTYADIVGDLRNFKKLPYSTNLKKLQMCFLGNNRSYVTVTTFLAFCILLIIIILICIGARNGRNGRNGRNYSTN